MEHNFYGSVDLESHLQTLQEASDWAQISRGRITQYPKLLREFFDGTGKSKEHALAYFESLEITELYELWAPKCSRYHGLKDKICKTLMKGPLLQQDELVRASSNASRNDAFTYRLAGMLLSAGINILAIEGISAEGQCETNYKGDITVEYENVVFDIQCKRPQQFSSFLRNTKEAIRQVRKETIPGIGFVAVDLSVMIASPTPQAVSSQKIATDDLDHNIFSLRNSKVDGLIGGNPKILGLILFGAKPYRVVEQSALLTATGDPIRHQLQYSLALLNFLLNESSPHLSAMRTLTQQFGEWMKTFLPM